jgi:small multidrug resistance pump
VTWLLLGAAIVLEVTATLSLRASEGLARWVWAIPIVIGYGPAGSISSSVHAAGS